MTSEFDQRASLEPRLRDRIVRAGAWTLGAYGIDLPLRLFSNLIATRLLFPEAFGAVAAASALIGGLALISDFGVHAVIVQSPRGDHSAFLRSAWVFQLWRGVIVWAILVGVCAMLRNPTITNLLPTASVFANPSFPLITASLGLSIVLSGAESTCIPLNVRRLHYRPIVVVDLAARILSLPIMLFWAWISPSVWALVGGSLAASLFRLVFSHLLVPGPWMALYLEKDHVREIIRFGRWVAVSSFATFIYQQCDVILLGLLMPGSLLGLYTIAKLLVSVGEGFIERLNSSLALPIFAEVIRKYPDKLLDRYYRFRLPVEIVAALLGGGLFASGSFVVNFLYDPRYAQAGAMLQILAIGTVLYPLLLIRGAFNATGETHIGALLSILQAVSLVVCVTVGFIAFGALGVIVGAALHRIVPSVAIIFLAHQRHWIGIWQELRIVPVFLVGLVVGKGVVLVAAAFGISNIHQFSMP